MSSAVLSATADGGLYPEALEGVLEALEGVAYATDTSGRIIAVGRSGWKDAGVSSEAIAPPPQGAFLHQSIAGGEVKALYRRMHLAAVSGARRMCFSCRCDAPDAERLMKMAVGPLRRGPEIVGVLYQATILSERPRPPVKFLEPKDALDDYLLDKAPLLTCCSFCAKVKWTDGGREEWVAPESYYQRGGASHVRLSHGACGTCAMRFGAMLGV